jgi:hypothetical protein
MKKSYYLIILLLIPLFIGATKKIMFREVVPVVEIESKPIKEIKIEPIIIEPEITSLIDALIEVESNGNDSAVGDTHLGEPSIGVLQIRPVMVREVNRILKLKGTNHRYKNKDRFSKEKSIEMFKIWQEFHHNDSDYEEIARSWNGGPKGPKNPRTYSYWKKVEQQLASL